MRRAAWLGLLASLACGSAGGTADRPPEVGADDGRFQVLVEQRRDADDERAGTLRVRVETRGDWHLADGAPASLRFESVEDCQLDPGEQGRDSALRDSPALLEFESGYRLDATDEVPLTGHIKFGICEGEAEQCAIIRREFRTRVTAG